MSIEKPVLLVNRGSQSGFAADKSFWKEILPVGVYVHPVPSRDPVTGDVLLDENGEEVHQEIDATPEILHQCVDTFHQAKDLGIKINFPDGHTNKSRDNLGWWTEMKTLLPSQVKEMFNVEPRHDRLSLWGQVNVPLDRDAEKVSTTIQDVSAYIVPAGHPELAKAHAADGTLIKLPLGISHVCATPKPVASDSLNFISVAASVGESITEPMGFEINLELPSPLDSLSEEQIQAALAALTTKLDTLPDSAYALVYEENGKKVQRLPYRHADGRIDLPALRSRLAQLSQIKDIPEAALAAAKKKLHAAAKTYLKDTKFDVASLGAVGDKLAENHMGNLWSAFQCVVQDSMCNYASPGESPMSHEEKLAEVKKATREFMRLLDEIPVKESPMAIETPPVVTPSAPAVAPPVVTPPVPAPAAPLAVDEAVELAKGPKKDESRKMFMGRCMKEGGNMGKCVAMWKAHAKDDTTDEMSMAIEQVEAQLGFPDGSLSALAPASLDKHPKFVELSAQLATLTKERDVQLAAAKDAQAKLATFEGAKRLDGIKARIEAAQNKGRLSKAMADKRLAELPQLSAADWTVQADKLETKLDVIEELAEYSVVPLNQITTAAPASPEPTEAEKIDQAAEEAIEEGGLSASTVKAQQKG